MISILIDMIRIEHLARAVVILAAVGLACGAAFGADAPMEAFWFDGFPGGLSPHALPGSARPFAGTPAAKAAFRGQTESVVLALKASCDVSAVVFRPLEVFPPAGGAFEPDPEPGSYKPLGAEILAVVHARRDPRRCPHLRILLGRRPALKRGSGALVPELLVHDVEAFRAGADAFRRNGVPPLGEPGPARAGDLGAGETAYFLLRYRVGEEAPAGAYQVDLAADPGAVRASVTIRVIEETLAPSEKLLCLSAEFDRPEHVRGLARAGLTFIRTRAASRWRNVRGRFQEMASAGVRAVSQNKPPETLEEVHALPEGPALFFYGVDEPQPKGRGQRRNWSRMARHVRLSERIHHLGGRVGCSMPFELAESLATPGGKVYRELAPLGAGAALEPLDWANYPLGFSYVFSTRKRRRIFEGETAFADVWAYMKTLQEEREAGSLDPISEKPVSRRSRTETAYFPLGYLRDPFLARWVFGAFVAQSELDGVVAWTAFRPRGEKVFDDADGADALVALPTAEGIAATYCFEAMRAGINDLRIIEHLREAGDAEVESMLRPWRGPTVGGRRIDEAWGEEGLAMLRRALMARAGG